MSLRFSVFYAVLAGHSGRNDLTERARWLVIAVSRYALLRLQLEPKHPEDGRNAPFRRYFCQNALFQFSLTFTARQEFLTKNIVWDSC